MKQSLLPFKLRLFVPLYLQVLRLREEECDHTSFIRGLDISHTSLGTAMSTASKSSARIAYPPVHEALSF